MLLMSTKFFLDQSLTFLDKLIMYHITMNINELDFCSLTNNELAELVNVKSHNTITASIKRLKDKNIIASDMLPLCEAYKDTKNEKIQNLIEAGYDQNLVRVIKIKKKKIQVVKTNNLVILED